MNRRLGSCFVVALALGAIMLAGASTAAALPTCESTYKPTELAGTSNGATDITALIAKWKVPAAVETQLAEQTVKVWVAGEAHSDGRKVADKTTTDRSFTFKNLGEKGETSEATEPVFIEPGTSYDLSILATYGKSTKYPEGCSVEVEGSKAATTRRIFGTNGGLCCSKEIQTKFIENAETLQAADITSDRIEMYLNAETEANETYGNDLPSSHEHHYINNDVIVGNTNDSEKLSTVNTTTWAKETREEIERAGKDGYTLMEVGNEMWLKGDGSGCEACAEPKKYAEMFIALSKEVQKYKESKAIPQDVKLLFDLTGDYYKGEGKWSNSNEKHGWLGDALSAESELKTRIEGLTFHPYDVEGATLAEEETYGTYEYDYGLRGLKVDYNEAVELGLKHTNVYATEFGVCRNKEFEERTCDTSGTLKTEAEDNKQAETNYKELLGSKFPEVKGLWWYAAYPVEDKYSFFNGWEPHEPSQLVTLVKELAVKG
jgi:hypothetical protein